MASRPTVAALPDRKVRRGAAPAVLHCGKRGGAEFERAADANAYRARQPVSRPAACLVHRGKE